MGPQAVRSLGQFTTIFGGRVAFSPLYDALDTFFNEGGNLAYVSRVVGPSAGDQWSTSVLALDSDAADRGEHRA